MAYGIALQDKFPFLTNTQYLEIRPICGDRSIGRTHQLLKFSIGDSDFFVDPTHGQIATKPNSLVVDRLENLEHHYKLKPYDHFPDEIICEYDIVIEDFPLDFDQDSIDQDSIKVHKLEVIDNKYALLDFHTCEHGAKCLLLDVGEEKINDVVYLAGVLQGRYSTEEDVSLAETDLDKRLAQIGES